MLIATETRKTRVQGTLRKPSTKRSEVVNPTSNNPPTISHSHGIRHFSHWTRGMRSLTSESMAEPRTIGNMIAPWRFIAFVAVLIGAAIPASHWLGSTPLGIIAALGLRAAIFLAPRIQPL